jgi:hypothetical protein
LTRDEIGETRLKSIEQKSLPADTFRVPDGYEQQEMPFGPDAHARDR